MLNSSLKDDDELQALVDDDSSINMDSVQHTHGQLVENINNEIKNVTQK